MQTIRSHLFNNPDKTFYILYINDAMECDVQKRTNETSKKQQTKEASVSRQKDKKILHRIFIVCNAKTIDHFLEYKLMTIPKE